MWLKHLHEGGEIPRDDLRAYPYWLFLSIAKIISGDRNGLAVYLVRPSTVVTICFDTQCNIRCSGKRIRFSYNNDDCKEANTKARS